MVEDTYLGPRDTHQTAIEEEQAALQSGIDNMKARGLTNEDLATLTTQEIVARNEAAAASAADEAAKKQEGKKSGETAKSITEAK